MNWLNRLLKKNELDRQLNSELTFHREQLIEHYLRKGLTLEAAQRQVQLELGGMEQAKEQCRDARGTRWLEAIAQDFRFALRGFANAPVFAFSAITAITLAVG